MTNNEKRLSELGSEIRQSISEYNKAYKEKDFSKVTAAGEKLSDLEDEYAEVSQAKVFEEVAAMENPVREALIVRSFPLLKHRVTREKETITGIEIIEDREKQIDLVRLFKVLGKKDDWKYMVQHFNLLMCMATGEKLGWSKSDISKISDSYAMDKLAKEIEIGKTPTSKTQLCKYLQSIVDAILMIPDAKGANTIKVNGRDVAYIDALYGRKGRKALTVSTANHGYMIGLVADAMHRVLTGKYYDLDYKMVKGADKVVPTFKKEASDSLVVEADEVVLGKAS